MLLKDVPSTLVEALLEKRLILHAGAGLSVGSGLPTGKRLAFDLQNELFRNGFVNVRPSPEIRLDLDVVAERYELAFGRQKLNEVLLKTFQKDGLKPNQGHRLAVKLFQRIITTNFDRLLEDAVQQDGRYAIQVVRDLQLPNTSIPDRTVIYKLHGDIATPDRIVITRRDYYRIPVHEGLKTEFRSILLKSNILFLGYGLADPDYLRELEFCRSILEEMPKSYAVMPGAGTDALFVKQCDRDNVDLFAGTAADFLQDLERAAQRYAVAAPRIPVPPTQVLISEAETNYRATVCEDFKWIDFKGIPVLGGYLRVLIDQLFVSPSARMDPVPELTEPVKGREPHPGPEDPRKSGLFRKPSEGKGIFDILKENPKVVILGDPGSGKTTLLRYIGYHLSLPEPQPAKIGLEKAYLPVLIPLREYAAFRKKRPKNSIRAFLPNMLVAHNLGNYIEVVQSALKRGEAILLLDGLDEVASEEERSHVASQVQQFSATYPACRLIVTSRKVGYPKAPIKNGLVRYVVDPLSDEEIQTFIDLWCKATEGEKEKQSLVEAIKNPRIRALAENPLLITIFGRVYRAYRNLPERRAELYAKCVEALLTTWDLTRDLPPVFQDAREANRILGPIALWIHRDCGGQFVSKEQLLGKITQLGNLPREREPSVLLTQIEERSGLLRQAGLDQYAFTHLTFQEYYAAREIVSTGNCFRQLRRFLRNDRWHEVITLTAGLLDDLGTKSVTEFLDCFLIRPSFPAKPTPLKAAKLNLLIACLSDKVEPESYIEEYVRRSLLSLATAEEYHRISLPRLAGFGKTRVGRSLLNELSQRIKGGTNDNIARSIVVTGYTLCKEPQDKIDFLMFALCHADPNLPIMANAAVAVSSLLAPRDATDVTKQEVDEQIREMPLDRRLKFVESMSHTGFGRDVVERAIETWISPEERSMLPQRPK